MLKLSSLGVSRVSWLLLVALGCLWLPLPRAGMIITDVFYGLGLFRMIFTGVFYRRGLYRMRFTGVFYRASLIYIEIY